MAQRKKNAKKKKKQVGKKKITKNTRKANKKTNTKGKKVGTQKNVKKKTNQSKNKGKASSSIKNKDKGNKKKNTQKKKKISSVKKQNVFQNFISNVKIFFQKNLSKVKEILKKIIAFLKRIFIRVGLWFQNRFIDIKKYIKKEKKKEKKEVLQKPVQKKIIEKKKTKHSFKLFIFIGVCVFILIALQIPYGLSIYNSEASKKKVDIPKFLKLKQECCNFSATFTTIRSTWSLKKDLEHMIKQYEVLDCDGKNYYYNPEEDYTITDYGVRNGFILNEVYITYGKGNSCDIDTTFKKLELLSDQFSIADAKKDGNYVMDDHTIYNYSAYTTFMENVEQKNSSTLRIVSTTKDKDVLITDLEFMKDGKFKVTFDRTRDRNSKDHRSIVAYKYDHIGTSNHKLYAYNGNKLETKNAYYLLTLPEE